MKKKNVKAALGESVSVNQVQKFENLFCWIYDNKKKWKMWLSGAGYKNTSQINPFYINAMFEWVYWSLCHFKERLRERPEGMAHLCQKKSLSQQQGVFLLECSLASTGIILPPLWSAWGVLNNHLSQT